MEVVSSRLRSPRQEVDEEDMGIMMLRMSVPGEPGLDYPIYDKVPTTTFSCIGKLEGGYYADIETGCQVVHTCGGNPTGTKYTIIKYSALCSNGSIYSQEIGTCTWWYLVDCESSEKYFFGNNNIRQDLQLSSEISSSQSSSSITSSSGGGTSGGLAHGSSSNKTITTISGSQSSSQMNNQGRGPPVLIGNVQEIQNVIQLIAGATTEIAIYTVNEEELFNSEYFSEYEETNIKEEEVNINRPETTGTPLFVGRNRSQADLSWVNGQLTVRQA